MGNKKLKTLTFPGLPDTYTIPQVPDGTAGHLATLDGNGNLADSGVRAAAIPEAERRLDVLYKLAKGLLYDTEAGLSPAYRQTVPSGAVAAEVGGVGGNTVVWNQQTHVNAGAWSTEAQTTTYYQTLATNISVQLISGHKYLASLFGFRNVSGNNKIDFALGGTAVDGVQYLTLDNGADDGRTSKIFTDNSGALWNKVDANNYAGKHGFDAGDSVGFSGFVCIDLTVMFGTGREPVDISDPRVDWAIAHAEAHPEYNAGALLSAPVLAVEAVGYNMFDKSNYNGINGYFSSDTPITLGTGRKIVYFPAEPNTAYAATRLAVSSNERFQIGYTKVKPESGVDVYGISSAEQSQTAGNRMTITTTTGADAKYLVVWAYWSDDASALDTLCVNRSQPDTSVSPHNGESVPYHKETLEIPAAVRALEGYGESPVGGDGNTLNLSAGTYTEIGHYVDGVWTALDAPVVTDVSALLPDNMLGVEAGGTLTFVQADDLALEVPSSVDYLVKLSEVTA